LQFAEHHSKCKREHTSNIESIHSLWTAFSAMFSTQGLMAQPDGPILGSSPRMTAGIKGKTGLKQAEGR
jgi:hypothetical protein